MTADLRSCFTEVSGVRIHWAERGTSHERTPLVMLHGMADSYLTWSGVAAGLASDRRVLMPDLPGCGLSGRPNASYKLEWHAQIIADWLRELELEEVDVVGHSFGGGVAQMLLLACRERIRRVVLVASGGLGREVGFWLRFATFPFFVERYGQPFMAFGTRHSLGSARAHGDEALVEALAKMNARTGTARAFSRTVRDVINFRGQTRYFMQRAREVENLPPIAVFWGEEDKLIPMKHGRNLVQHLSGATFRSFPGCGHYLHREQPESFADAVRAFLDAPDATPAILVNATERGTLA